MKTNLFVLRGYQGIGFKGFQVLNYLILIFQELWTWVKLREPLKV